MYTQDLSSLSLSTFSLVRFRDGLQVTSTLNLYNVANQD
jgi:hypothetical protein